MAHRVYLAGPDVFLPDAEAAGERLKEVCRRHGLEGVYPLDSGVKPRAGEAPHLFAKRIFEGNVLLIHGCHGVLANVTPFRGPSADVGTAWEMGYAHALRKPVVAYVEEGQYATVYVHRVLCRPVGAVLRDSDGRLVEDFGLYDNLMLACSSLEMHDVRNVDEAAEAMAELLGARP